MTTRMGALASAFAFIGGSGAVIASQTGGGGAVWIVLVGVVGSAIGAFAANREAVESGPRKRRALRQNPNGDGRLRRTRRWRRR